MRLLPVEAYEDQSRPGGGHAVIRIRGLEDLPDDLTFRLRPADGSSALDRTGSWPEGERRPLSTRATAEGAELLIGPEIVESPELLPGTLTILDIPRCGVRGEFLWPSIRPIARPKRRRILAAGARRSDADGEPVPAVLAEPLAFGEATDASSSVIPEPDVSGDASARAWAAHAASVTAAAVARSDAFPPLRRGGEEAAGHVARTGTGRPRHHLVAALVAAFLVGTVSGAALSWGHLLGPLQPQSAAQPAAPSIFATVRNPLLALVEPTTTSPQGAQTRDGDPRRLLERADLLINGPPAARDAVEARFLIRRALSLSLAQDRMLWAVTQLGSLDAEPGPLTPPDYAQAAGLWELAATLGDPVAMCFLAALHEHGLGTPHEPAVALTWYLRARAAGGCPGVDDAIARLKE